MRAEISYDLVMEEDMNFVEGTFRLPGGEWQVVVVSKRPVPSPETKLTTWDSGVTGLVVTFPLDWKLDRAAVETLLGQVFGVGGWDEVHGPDSIRLR
ncbi:MAG: hypothetical protein K2V38_22705 [Gemmataceae bacterium]|nr:hypothetical protein [Gemmataceae bacterium]